MNKWEKDGFVQGKNNPDCWREVCQHKKQALEKEQQGRIRVLQIKGVVLQQKEKEILNYFQSIGGSKPDNVLRFNVIKGNIYGALGLILFCASIAFLNLSFEPFQLGWKAPLIALATVLATSFLMEIFLSSTIEKRFILISLSSIGLIFLLSAHVIFAVLRAKILQELILSTSEESSIYSSLIRHLKPALPLLALALELSCGVALYSAIERIFSPDVNANNELKSIRNKMVFYATEIERLKSIPDVFESEYSSGALQAVSEKNSLKNEEEISRKARIFLDYEKKVAIYIAIAILLIFLFSIFASSLYGQELVVGFDMTGSSKARDYNNQEEIKKNISGVAGVLRSVLSGSQITIIGITDNSFSRPYFILKKSISADPGYFKERITAQRKSIVDEWGKKVKTLKAIYAKTDVFGAINLASVIFSESSEKKKYLILFSDMRNSSGKIDLETPTRLDTESLIAEARRSGLIPFLKEVKVFVLGVSTAGKSFQYWEDLKGFWIEYFKSSGAILKSYSFNREVKYD